MIKTLIIIFSIFFSNLTLAMDSSLHEQNISKDVKDIIDPPGVAALNIMVSTLSSLKELKKQNKDSKENVEALIRIKLLPNLATDVAAKIALDQHWDGLNIQQRQFFQHYISESLIQDYIGMLASYEKLDSVQIFVDPNIRRKDNKAIVKLNISINSDSKPFSITLKLIRLNSWNVYDVVFSGVSIVKNYQAQFNSYIKRKGVDALIERSKNKLEKLK
ncbi:toluene tolerance family protein [uncultured Gammaproteobacteria bacterium]|uniref:MlaC/ttg2D family ABC transporter substrate-binding protein n=1 Tax=Bathymodiolus heckerae thiotrophic gill symbiont TaxID=1052212 RepID=UPI0010B13054|nr:ABC transporter substrate-binding protein [Bathymodiolus heckerae thiotrophic gill symbiont]CAC9953675.1 toluene tolerance family protein [uncultured Gammaproteobacteria bacterium]CAC9958425.1 toluene tolerance family protein [uncultured Gammaproteobacteria bacterium]SHN91413.1 toluene tolerance family protein [Bathymodiolus heckerae thiotrophic gill symbiont]